jgi:hypothetical protein
MLHRQNKPSVLIIINLSQVQSLHLHVSLAFKFVSVLIVSKIYLGVGFPHVASIMFSENVLAICPYPRQL